MTELPYDDEVVENVEIYEGLPDRPGPDTNEDGDQDDEVPLGGGVALFAKVSPARTREETLEWYATHQTASQIGFDPDGMCLKVCRTARNIGPKYATAKQAQDATPQEHRVEKVRDLRKSMIIYFDDPSDSNRAGHIVTLIGRVPNFNPDDLADLLVETNSVVANEVVVVRGDYFWNHWGDSFQFGATWLNGEELDVTAEPKFDSKIEKFQGKEEGVYHLNLLLRAGEDRPAAQRVYDGIMRQVNGLPDHPSFVRLREFKDKAHAKDPILDMNLLNAAVEDRGNREGKIKRSRDEIRRLIASLPDE